MKKLFFSLLLTVASIVAFAQSPIDGNWKGSRETANGTFEVNYTFGGNYSKVQFSHRVEYIILAMQ